MIGKLTKALQRMRDAFAAVMIPSYNFLLTVIPQYTQNMQMFILYLFGYFVC